MPDKDGRPIWGYGRASTEKQDTSVADQRAAADAAAAALGGALDRWFEDDGEAGSDLKRPGLNAILKALRASPVKGTVIIWSSDRLVRGIEPRDLTNVENLIRHELRWKLLYLKESAFSGNDDVDDIMGTIRAIYGGRKFYIDLATGTLRGMKSGAENGEWQGGKIPYALSLVVVEGETVIKTIPRGEHFSKANGQKLFIKPGDEEEQRIVRLIFEVYTRTTKGHTLIADDLNGRGVPSPEGGKWCSGTVKDIIRSPYYAGEYAWARRSLAKWVTLEGGKPRCELGVKQRKRRPRNTWIKGTRRHEGIVDQAMWDEAQRILDERGVGVTGRTDHDYVLSGVITCGQCHKSMTARHKPVSYLLKDGGKGRRSYYIYECVNRKRECRRYNVKQAKLDEVVFEKLAAHHRPLLEADRVQLRAEIIKRLRKHHQLDAVGDVGLLKQQMQALTREIDRGKARLLKVPDDVFEELAAEIAASKAKQQALALTLARLEGKAAQEPHIEAMADDVLGLLDDLSGGVQAAPPGTQKAFMRKAVKGIELRFTTDHPPPSSPKKKPKPRHRFLGGTMTLSPLLSAAGVLVSSPVTGDPLVAPRDRVDLGSLAPPPAVDGRGRERRPLPVRWATVAALELELRDHAAP